MENFLNQIPKPLLAFIVILAGVIIFFIAKPPHTICDTERDAFAESLKGELYPEGIDKKKGRKPPQILKARSQCRQGNSSGACSDYFTMLKNISAAIKMQTTECYPIIIEAPSVRPALQEGLLLMTQLAWGEQPPENFTQGWFTTQDLSAFCTIKDILKDAMSEDEWTEFHSQILRSLPGPKPADAGSGVVDPRPRPSAVESLGEEKVFRKSLLSLNCRNYL